jgi:hypothetical protein
VSITETLLSVAFGTYTNGPCCASTVLGTSIAMLASQMLPSSESLSWLPCLKLAPSIRCAITSPHTDTLPWDRPKRKDPAQAL